jgi:hypothetical protein
MGTVRIYHPKAVVGRARKDTALLALAVTVKQKLTNNSNFPNSGQIVNDLGAATATFSTALSNMSTQKGVSDARTSARQDVLDTLGNARDMVNGAAAKLPPDEAKAVIESSGFKVKKVSSYSKPALAAKYGGLSGSVQLIARSPARDAVFYFEVSTDQKNWVACPNVMKCRTLVTGLTVGTTYYFRFHAQTRKGLTDLSTVVSFIAH